VVVPEGKYRSVLMAAPLAAGVRKICVKCGTDVSGSKRMKDKEGNYWCVPCGEQDKLRRIHSEAGICEVCGESFHHASLMDIGGQHLCVRCRKRKYGAGGGVALRKIVKSVKGLFGR
jgi:formylmethanofuran dehydrogenase subunit E